MENKSVGSAAGTFADEEIVERVLQGEPELFEILMRRHNQRIFRVVRSIIRSDALAEDVMQEAYLKAYVNLGQYSRTGPFAAWLTRIAVHESLRVRKRRSRWDARDMTAEEAGDGADLPVENYPERDVSLQALLTDTIDDLPTSLRVVFVLRHVEELSVRETAESLGISTANVKTRFHRARKLLRESLERSLGSELSHVYGFAGHRCDRVVAGVMARIGGGEVGLGEPL